jgi:rhamnosyl/mannosyltransferase
MRITMINKYYDPHLGGIEYHMRDLAEELHARGTDVRILVANEGRDEVRENVRGLPVHRLPRTFAYASTPVAPRMPRAIAQAGRDSDLLHLHFPYPWGEVSWLTSRTHAPTVMTYHSDIVRQRILGKAYRPIAARVLDRLDAIIVSSPNMVEHSEMLAPRADKCRVVPFGIHVEHFADTPETLARAAELRAPHVRPIVLFIGRLVYYKGVDVLVRAMEHLDADLVIVGSGPLEGELREFAVAHGMRDRITFLPPQPFSELVAWYHAADVFCLPSVARSEAFGLVQIEAHAAGTPVVSTDLTTGVPYANKDGVSGLTVPVGNTEALAAALERLLSDHELRTRLGAQAKERAWREFSIDRMVTETLAVYREALA